MIRIRTCHYVFVLSATCLAIVLPKSLFAQSDPAGFTTVFDTPPTNFIQSLVEDAPIAESNQFDSDTQVNVYNGGGLGFGASAGSEFGTNSNIEVNFFGGGTEGDLQANSGSTINVFDTRFGGSFGDISANSGSNVNISGGVVESIFANSGSDINISGGVLGGRLDAFAGSNVEISGGIVNRFFVARSGSSVTYSAGLLDAQTAARPGSDFEILGGDFRLNGVATNNSIVTVNKGDFLSGVLQDGSAFVFAPNFVSGGDQSMFRLTQRAIPDFDPDARFVVNAPTDFVPPSLRQGQTLILEDGGQLPFEFTSVGGNLEIRGGSAERILSNILIGSRIELVDTEIDVSGGSIFAISAYGGSANISGGEIGVLEAFLDNNTDITSGDIGSLTSESGSLVNIFNGEIGSLDVAGEVNLFDGDVTSDIAVTDGGVLNIFGSQDAPSALRVFAGGTLNFSGGIIPSNLRVADEAFLNLFGSEFLIDDTNISDLALDEEFIVVDRNVILSGVLADGSAFSYALNTGFGGTGRIGEGTRLTVTLTEATPVLLGDVNRDGAVSFLDISPFISILSDGGFQAEADTNEDGEVSFLDISSFISLLTS